MPFSSRPGSLTICLFAIAATGLGCKGTQSQSKDVAPYDIVEVVPGVFAAIANIGGTAVGNAGIIEMGDQVFVFDTGLTPEAGRQLRAAADSLTGHRVAFVINSHFHDDHIGGNQAFDAPTYFSTTPTQSAVKAAGPKRPDKSVENARAALSEINDRLRTEQDPVARRELASEAGLMTGIVNSSEEFERVVPTVVWDRRLNFTGSLRRIKFIPTATSHVEGEALLLLEADSVLFTGDIVTTDRHPVMLEGDPDAWATVLDSVLTLSFKILVPGHGPIGDRDSVVRMRDYLLSVERAAQSVREGTSIESIPIDSAFSDWMYGQRFRENVRFVMDRRSP